MRKKLLKIFLSLFAFVTLGLTISTANADEPYLGEVRLFAGNFAPRGWAFCNGQILQISQNTALFSLLGTTYGGDGRITFALPDMRGRAMMGARNGPGLTPRQLGEKSGSESVTLSQAQVPSHSHTLRANNGNGDSVLTNDRVVASAGRLGIYNDSANVDMDATAISDAAGAGQSHNNMQPYVTMSCIIAIEGIFPSRS